MQRRSKQKIVESAFGIAQNAIPNTHKYAWVLELSLKELRDQKMGASSLGLHSQYWLVAGIIRLN